MSGAARCQHCGSPLPCGCPPAGGRDPAGGDRPPLLSLAAGSEEDPVSEDDRFTRLLREVKSGVLRRPFIAAEEGRPLLRRVRRLGRLIERQDLVRADGMAERCLADVLHFPGRSRRRWRRLACFLIIFAIAAASWLLVRTLSPL